MRVSVQASISAVQINANSLKYVTSVCMVKALIMLTLGCPAVVPRPFPAERICLPAERSSRERLLSEVISSRTHRRQDVVSGGAPLIKC
jgi:hypothetical protein